MIKDLFVSFSDNFKEKTKNPFLGTYLLVWLIRNWKLIYTLFNFDNGAKLADKIKFIEEYYSKMDFIDNLLQNIYWSFGLLISTYILLNVSRLIVNLSEKRLTPWIYKITDSKSIVLKEEYERVRADNDDLQVRLDKERESKSRLESRIKGLEDEIIKVAKGGSTAEMAEVEGEYAGGSNADSTSDLLFQKLSSKNLVEQFLNICTRINAGEAIGNNEKTKDYFIEQGLIVFLSSYGSEKRKYKITKEGEGVLKKIRRSLEN